MHRDILKAARKERHLSQRQLAASAGVSFRTIQLIESGKHDPQLSTMTRIGKALGYPGSSVATCLEDLFTSPPDSVRIVSEQIRQHGEASWKVWLFNFVDAFRRTRDIRYVSSPPSTQLSSRVQALFASTIETLCTELSFGAPPWCTVIPSLKVPWFVAEMESLKPLAFVESPLHFRKRNIFVLTNFLDRA